MASCQCEVLNVLSGALAQEYLTGHLDHHRTDGMGRAVHRCTVTEVTWVEERRPSAYGDSVTVLRRLDR
ncbi:MAG: hypothetical protein JJT89_17100 [Nitriliruptoraceae bacterium]|nr:hypothetical protein [Nitriliruptoraceae bacterium]